MNVFRSAWMPAPPPLSEPAMVSALFIPPLRRSSSLLLFPAHVEEQVFVAGARFVQTMPVLLALRGSVGGMFIHPADEPIGEFLKFRGGVGVDPIPVKPVLRKPLRFEPLPDLHVPAGARQQHRQYVGYSALISGPV